MKMNNAPMECRTKIIDQFGVLSTLLLILGVAVMPVHADEVDEYLQQKMREQRIPG